MMRTSTGCPPRTAASGWRGRLVGLAGGTLLQIVALGAQQIDTGTIEGRVLSAASGTYLGNVRITLDGTTRETITDAAGSFRLSNVTAGQARISATYVGLDTSTETVSVQAGRTVELNLELTRSGIVALEKFEVLEKREQNAQTLALNQQRQSPNIKNVVASDEYPAGSDDNVADFIRFIPGVSIVYSGRAGTDASLRGMPSNTSGITMDGVELSGAFTGNTRTVSLLAVPTSNIATVEVTKVPTPDMSATGLGGSINISTRSGFERAKPQVKYNVFSAFAPQYGLSLTYGAGATGGPTFTQGAATGVGTAAQTFSWQNLVSHTTHALLKYTHLGDTWKIDASASYSYSSFYFMPDYHVGYFGGASITIPNLVIRGEGNDGTATRAADLGPDRVTIRDRAGNPVSPHDGRLYTVNSATSSETGNVVDKAQARVDFRRELRLGVPFFLQAGASVVQETQKLYNWGRTYNFRPTAAAADRLAGNYDLVDPAYSQAMDPLFGSQV